MAVLIAAGVKVAGKALIKKLGTKLAQAGAKKIAQQGAQTLAQEGVKKIGTSVAQKGVMSNAGGQIKKAKNLFDKAQDIKKTKDSILGKSKKDQQTEESSENQPQKKSENK
ncbi:MAG TPA: hypothetical protein P5052_03535 [Candidatus Paceibacterota bacterium]|jgi:hypothetical protein|nr:hypothetical protein [Candidatus Paceibacterota bacterium]HRZ29797.1 hypothetical protein [Candidatus Paceibacterota bacterium]